MNPAEPQGAARDRERGAASARVPRLYHNAARYVRTAPWRNLPAIVGAIDGSVALAYAFQVDPVNWHAGTLTLKILLAFFFLRGQFRLSKISIVFLLSIVPLLVVDGVLLTAYMYYVRILCFAIHALLTLLIVRRTNVPQYATAFACVVAVMAVVHLYQCEQGLVIDNFGRYYYFHGTQSALAGEMGIIGSLAAAWAMRRWQAVVLIAIFIADELYTQSRGALIGSGLALFAVLAFDSKHQLHGKRAFWLSMIVFAFVLAMIAFGKGNIVYSTVSDVLHLEDPARNASSGFSGRTRLWDFAVYMIARSPWIGYGAEYLESIGYPGAHNIVLMALMQNGLVGLPPLGVILYCIYSVGRQSKFGFVLMLAMMPLFLFGDRYLNINPYPFVLYIFILAHTRSARVAYRRGVGRVRQRPAGIVAPAAHAGAPVPPDGLAHRRGRPRQGGAP